jgi:hypothetical protein
MKILGIEGMTPDQLQDEVARGGTFVYYQYCVSVVLMTFKRPSDIYFIRSGESALKKGLRFSLLSFVAGWWGIPWGPIYTIGALANNFGGGTVVTREVLNQLAPRAA